MFTWFPRKVPTGNLNIIVTIKLHPFLVCIRTHIHDGLAELQAKAPAQSVNLESFTYRRIGVERKGREITRLMQGT